MARNPFMPRHKVRDFGTCLNFNGSSQYVRRNTSGIFRTTGYSIELWLKGYPATAGTFIYAEGNTASNNTKVGLRTSSVAGGKSLSFFVRNDAGSGLLAVDGNIPVLDGEWHHTIWTDNNGTCALYVDNVADSASFNYTPSGVFTLTDMAIGALYGNGGGGSAATFFKGLVDKVRLWPTVLTSTQISNLFYADIKPSTPFLEYPFDEGSGNTATDISGNGRDGDLTGHAPTYSTDVYMKARTAVS